jgi:PII-like signaling protein
MPNGMAVQVTIYLNEADQWHHRPLHMEILNYLRKENVYAATALHAVAGFLGRQQVKTSHLVDAGGKLPVIIIFADTDEHVSMWYWSKAISTDMPAAAPHSGPAAEPTWARAYTSRR